MSLLTWWKLRRLKKEIKNLKKEIETLYKNDKELEDEYRSDRS